MWGALENLNMIAHKILSEQSPTGLRNMKEGTDIELADRLISYSRLTLILTFKACQDLGPADQLIALVKQGLITEEERQWLLVATPGKLLCCVSWVI